MIQNLLLIALGGAGGAVSRYLMMSWVGGLLPQSFPYSTLTVNVLGSFAMGVLVALLAKHLPPHQNEIRLFVAVGFLGAFTTFSAFSLDVLTLFERGQMASALLYIGISVMLCVLALALGLILWR